MTNLTQRPLFRLLLPICIAFAVLVVSLQTVLAAGFPTTTFWRATGLGRPFSGSEWITSFGKANVILEDLNSEPKHRYTDNQIVFLVNVRRATDRDEFAFVVRATIPRRLDRSES